MLIINTLQEFVHDLRIQKLRVFLTVFGVTWGTVAVVVLLSFGTGFKKQIAKNMHGIGEGIVIVFPGRTTKPYQGYGIGRPIRLVEKDAALLAQNIPGIQTISPEYSQWNSTLRLGTKVVNPLVSGVNPDYGGIRNIIPKRGGRFINVLDMESSRHVIFLGDSLKYLLFNKNQAVGNYVLLDGVPFQIIGIMRHKTQNSSYNRRDQDRAFIPAATFSAFYGRKRITDLVYKPANPAYSSEISKKVYAVLGKKYKFDPADKNALSIWDTTEMDKIIRNVFLGLNIFLGLIGSFTLIVGGIGVANIMYVVVQERTREIGIKRAVGAHRRDILLQFLAEAFFIIGIGAALGFLISWGLVLLMDLIPMGDFVGHPAISGTVVGVAAAVLGVIGLVAAYFPAKNAANLRPIDCLRYR
ncbi:macrolide export ATP-binding/permease protein MacB [bacterium BMS3Abin05]|nr:macrolide export ATP-binding/permease protein MacB [bacterium BMS3Abin05]GBE28249.1 macrolide export ATP-binding/permease protein MacB [bacterium BMS3Bbin03]HDL79051.1 FtsX-like permease family protein [Bacteroidota bacterium]HDZ11900.1 FtsX-like permease family protein [Bacteroidota bacterium]